MLPTFETDRLILKSRTIEDLELSFGLGILVYFFKRKEGVSVLTHSFL